MSEEIKVEPENQEQENLETSSSDLDLYGSTAVVKGCIKQTHVDLKNEFLSRVKTIINEDCKIKNYGVSESYGSSDETVELETKSGVKVRITVSTEVDW